MTNKSPTEQAILYFESAFTEADYARKGFWSSPAESPANFHNLAASIRSLARGLKANAIGLRAVYMKLEEIEAKIDGRGPAAPPAAARVAKNWKAR